MGSKTIISVALNGARRTKCENQAVPITPQEIAREAAVSCKAGAAIAHIHARTDDGKATQEPQVYADIIRRVQDECDIIVQISIGGLGFSVDELLQPLVIEPEMASFPLRALKEDDADPLVDLRRMALLMKHHKVRPELDASSVPMLKGATELNAEGALAAPLCFGLVLRDVKSMDQAALELVSMQNALPAGSSWWAMKGGAHSRGVAALALSLGGHARTGFEDTLTDPLSGELAASNDVLVGHLADLACKLGREPASPNEARKILGMEYQRGVT